VASRFHAVLIIFLYLLLLIGAVASAALLTLPAKPTVDDLKNFGSAGIIGVTAISAVMTAWLSIRNITAQTKASESLERIKMVLDKRIPAHGDLFSAASNYYRELAPLESGQFDVMKVEDAETKMKEVEGRVVYVGEEYARVWMNFWQSARYVKEKAHAELHDVEARKEHWKPVSKSLAGQLEEMRRIAAKSFGV
jgi:hypothetical protein